MRAVVYRAPEEFRVEEVDTFPLSASEVRVRTLAVGVCGTDHHLHLGGFGATFPLTPGHEIVGIVEEIGSAVPTDLIGQRVAIDNTIYCMECTNCKRGEFAFCADLKALGVNAPGGFSEYCVADAGKCYPIGDLSLDAATLIEPTACAVHGLDVLQLKPGADVLIIGAGPTGQILGQLIAHGGAARVTVAAPTQFKLDIALQHGANQTVLLDRHDFSASQHELLALAPDGFDVVVEATGVTAILDQVIPHVRSGGTLMVYGMAAEHETMTVSPYEIFRREITVKGSFAQTYAFDRAIRYLQSGRVNPAGIVTHRFDLDHYQNALDALRAPDCLKAVVIPVGGITVSE